MRTGHIDLPGEKYCHIVTTLITPGNKMRLLRTLVLFNQGNVMSSAGWQLVYESYRRAIEHIHYPLNSGALTIRRKAIRPGSNQFNRNGVGFLRNDFLRNLVEEGWNPEVNVALDMNREPPALYSYPSGAPYREPITSRFGGFDFLTKTPDGLIVAIEWETGNISSSHRSMNKLAIALKEGIIGAGVLILPSRDLYAHLTDRIGNIGELSGYLEMWASLGAAVQRGLLAITVVEHDHISDDPSLPYLPTGNDGRAEQGRSRG